MLILDFDPSLISWKWEIPAAKLNVDKLTSKYLGGGVSGAVYLGHLYKTPVAVKFLNTKTKEKMVNIKHEVGLMVYVFVILANRREIRHPNIVLCMGICYKDNETCIVMECMDCTLRQYLLEFGHRLSFTEKLQMVIDIGRGINWLHNRRPPILHKDLHSKNILVWEI